MSKSNLEAAFETHLRTGLMFSEESRKGGKRAEKGRKKVGKNRTDVTNYHKKVHFVIVLVHYRIGTVVFWSFRSFRSFWSRENE